MAQNHFEFRAVKYLLNEGIVFKQKICICFCAIKLCSKQNKFKK